MAISAVAAMVPARAARRLTSRSRELFNRALAGPVKRCTNCMKGGQWVREAADRPFFPA
jgi:hypothetical protein